MCPDAGTFQWDLGPLLRPPGLQRVYAGSPGSLRSGLRFQGAGILLHSFVLKDSRIRSPSMPEKRLRHRSANQVMKTIQNNEAALVLKPPLPGRSRSLPCTSTGLDFPPLLPQGAARCPPVSASSVCVRMGNYPLHLVKLRSGEDPAL